MDSVGEGEGGKIWENGIETCKISCMKCSDDSQSVTECDLKSIKVKDPLGVLSFLSVFLFLSSFSLNSFILI